MKLALAVCLILCLALGGCSQSNVLTTLESSVAATEILVQSLAIAGKNPQDTANQITTAISALPQAYSETAAELSTTDDAAIKAVKISGYFAATVSALNSLPPQAQVYAQAISASIQVFLQAVSTGNTALKAGKPVAGTSPALDANTLR